MSVTRTVEVEEAEFPWWLLLIQGVAAIILGILLFARPAATMIVMIQFLGIYWLITGIFSVVLLIWDKSEWAWKLTSGILGILAGILIIQNLIWSTLILPVTLALLLGGIGVIIGISQLIDAFRGSGIGIGILGAFNVLLGFILITRPVIAGFAIPWVLGSVLIVGGILAIIAAFGTRYIEDRIKEAEMWAEVHAESTPTEQVEAGIGEKPESYGDSEIEADFEYKAVPEVAMEGAAVAEAALIEMEKDEGEVGMEEVGEVDASAMDESEGAPVPLEELAEDEAVNEDSQAVFTGNVDPADPMEMAKFQNPLEYVEGIGPVYSEKLNAIGLVSCLDLLVAGASRRGREEIAEKSGISGKLILEWVNQIDLYRVKGVGSEYADLLEDAGIDTVVELAQRSPTNLFDKLVEVNSEKKLVRQMPTQAQVEDWVSQAKGLPRVISY